MLSSFKFLHEKKNEVRKRKLMGLFFAVSYKLIKSRVVWIEKTSSSKLYLKYFNFSFRFRLI